MKPLTDTERLDKLIEIERTRKLCSFIVCENGHIVGKNDLSGMNLREAIDAAPDPGKKKRKRKE